MKNISSFSKVLMILLATGILSLFASGLSAQTTVYIGANNGANGTTTYPSPLQDYYRSQRAQYLYREAELNAQGIVSGVMILSLGWVTNSTSFANHNIEGYSIGLKNTNLANLSVSSWETGFTQVYGPTDFSYTSGFAGNIMFPITNGFIYTGGDLIVEVCGGLASGGITSNPACQWTTGLSGTVQHTFRTDTQNGCGNGTTTNFGTVTTRPRLVLDYVVPINCAGTPTPMTISGNTSTLCIGSTLNLNTTNFDPAILGLTHQWESNTGAGWEVIPGATSLSYSTANMPVNTSFRLVTTCSFSTDQAISNELFVTINELPVIELNASTYAYCPGESAVMIASGALNYTWSPATGLNSTTGDMVGANPTQPTTYTVTGTDVNGCIGTASGFVSSIANSTVSAAYTPEQNCAPGNPVNITLSGAPESISGMGTWEYRWLEADGITEALGWTASDEFNFVPTTDAVYTYLYQRRSTSCPSATTTPVAVNISIGFGVDDANLVHVNCNVPLGSITTINPFGQSDYTEIYSNDFSASAGANTTLHGVAAVNGGRMVITPSVTNSSGGFTILPSGANLAGDMNVSYLMTVDLPINTFGTGGADGITWSFGDDALYTNPGGQVNGKGTKLRVSFDSAGNGTENGNAPGIYVVYGWTATNAFGPTSPQTLAYTPNTALWKNQTDVPVDISVTQNGLLTLIVNGVTVFSEIQLPQAFVDADKSTWRHLFSAGTGGDANRHAIDNLNITYGSFNFGITTANAGMPSEWQSNGTFTGLTPGIYDIWMSNPADVTCSKMVGTYEILNNYPLVNLGADTTICPGTTITLDAGNPGSTYTWSNSNQYSQTIEVSQAGTYVVNLTDPAGCFGIGSIQVSVAQAPQGAGILAQGEGFSRLFAVINPMNAASYDWNFGDGTTVIGGSSVQNHTYTNNGTYTVTVTLHDAFGCAETLLTQSVTVLSSSASLEDDMANALTLYPNPASDNVTVASSDLNIDFIEVMTVSGQLVGRHNVSDKLITIATNNWQAGVYFIKVYSNNNISILKLVVQ
jgi:hypothetical protein